MRSRLIELAWLGGLLEGEGCFRSSSGRPYPYIFIAMTDADVVKHAAKILEVHVRGPYINRNHLGTKPLYCCQINGHRAVLWMKKLYKFLGERRKKKILSIIEFWEKKKHRASRGTRTKPKCHPRRQIADIKTRLCDLCYKRKRRAEGALW